MICKSCGRANEQGAKFCKSCGAPLEGGQMYSRTIKLDISRIIWVTSSMICLEI